MNTRTIAASILSLGLLASAAVAGNAGSGFCGGNTRYDDDTLSCVTRGGETVTDRAGIVVPGYAKQASNGNVGDFINETTQDRSERSSR